MANKTITDVDVYAKNMRVCWKDGEKIEPSPRIMKEIVLQQWAKHGFNGYPVIHQYCPHLAGSTHMFCFIAYE